MKNYNKPEMNIEVFEVEDVITVSGGVNNPETLPDDTQADDPVVFEAEYFI